MAKNIYLLKDLAKKTGYSVHTIKYYLKCGLIRESGRSPETNYRYFSDSAIRELKRIRQLRRERRSIKEIQEIVRKG